jgi:sec-independent protein translocase protein TatC
VAATNDREQPFVAHLIELRDRILRIVAVVLVAFLLMAPFANYIYTALAGPLLAHLPASSSMIAIDVASPFLTPFKLTLVLALFLTIPWSLYQIWAFVAPGLYKHEQRLVMPLLVSSTLLFYAGMAFAYFVVFPLVFGFLIGVAPEGVEVMTDISRYLDFVLTIFFAFGLAFEVPVATVLLVMIGATTPEALREKRPYIIVGAFVMGMLLTPPDMISQTLLAIPIWLLFEVGVFASRYMLKRKADAARAGEELDMESELDRAEADEQGLNRDT